MARRPEVRKMDLERAAEAAERFTAIGLKPARITFSHEGFALDFTARPDRLQDEIDAALAAFERDHHGDD